MNAYQRSQQLQLAYVDRVLWAIQRRTPVTVADIVARFECSRSSAFRWRGALEDARQRALLMQLPRPGNGGQG